MIVYNAGCNCNCSGQVMDDRGVLKVNNFLQVEGEKNIFAFGDCSNADVKKQVVSIMAQLPVVTKNVVAYLAGKELEPYKAGNSQKTMLPCVTFRLFLGLFQHKVLTTRLV